MNSESQLKNTLVVNTSDIPSLVNLCYSSHNNLLIVGNPGTGKSTIIKSMENEGYKVTMLTGSSTYEETVNGIPYRDTMNKSVVAGLDLSVYNVPSWLEQIVNYKGKQILFIDEYNTADPQVLKTFLSLLTERKVPTQPDSMALPDDCVIVAAMNPPEQNDGEQLIRPMKSRFMVVELVSSRSNFKDYIVDNHGTSLKNEDVAYLLEATDYDKWGQEGRYNELNPRSFTNFLRALDSVKTDGGDLKTECPRLSLAFFGQAIDYPTEGSIEAQEERIKQEKIKKNPYPTREELEQLSDFDLEQMFNKMSTKMTTKADKVCLDIQDIIKDRKASNGTSA